MRQSGRAQAHFDASTHLGEGLMGVVRKAVRVLFRLLRRMDSCGGPIPESSRLANSFGPYSLAITRSLKLTWRQRRQLPKKVPIFVALDCPAGELVRCQYAQITKHFVTPNRVSTHNWKPE